MSPTSSLTPEQHALRRQGLGASEVAAVLGLDPHRTPLDVYLEKTGQVLPFEGNEFTRWGNRLEDDIVEGYQERHPTWTILPSNTVVGPEPWMLATPDRRVVLGPLSETKTLTPSASNDRGLECKNRGLYDRDHWGDDGSDEVPHSVAIQCHWGMLCTGMKAWDVAVLLGGNDFREYSLHYDQEIADSIVAAARSFWFENVQKKAHPSFTGAESDHKFLVRTYPTHSDEIVKAGPDMATAIEMLRGLRERRSELEQSISQTEANIKEFIGNRRGVEGPGFKITWTYLREVEVKAFTRPATRRFLTQFKTPKGV